MLFQSLGSGWSNLIKIQKPPQMLSFLPGLLFISGATQGLPCMSPCLKSRIAILWVATSAFYGSPAGQEKIALLQSQSTGSRCGISQDPAPAPSQVLLDMVCGPEIMREKQRHRHNAMAPQSPLRERGWGKRASAALAQVLCQVWYLMPPCRHGQMFASLCTSGYCAESES